MFTVMLSRSYLVVVFFGLMLAFGAGWALYELHFEQTAEVAVPKQTAGDGQGPQPPAGQAPVAPPPSAGAPNQTAGQPRPEASQAAQATRSLEEVEALRAQVDRPKAQVEASAPTATTSGEVVQTGEPEPDMRAEAAVPSGEPESSSAGRAAETGSARAPPQTQPPVSTSGAEPGSPEDETRSRATRGDSAADEDGPSPAAAPPSGAPPPPESDRDIAVDAPPDPSVPAQSAASPPKPEPSDAPPRTAEESAGSPRTAGQESVALADPTTPAEGDASASSGTGAADDAAPTDADAPGAGTAPQPGGAADVADEPAPEVSRLAETIRRAVSALFGGAMDEPASPATGEAEVAAIPEAAPTGPAPDRPGPADIDPGAAPRFDIVRVEPGGRAVVAGRAAPGAEVEVRSGDRVIERVRADRRGEWVALPAEPLGAGVQELSLTARVEDRPALHSEEVVVVAVPGQPSPPAASHPIEPRQAQPAQLAAAEPADEAFAVALPREGAGKGRILQAPGRIGTDGALALEMLDYDDEGRIRLSGEASAGAALRIYVDNQPAGTAVVGPSGRWDAVLEHTLSPGDYMLRLDQVGESGKPDARLETPFTRVSQPPVEGAVQVDYVIVQPGNSLWRIARRVLGEGMRYVHIYEANQAHIRDPDLIYPGQVFEMPSGLGPAG